MTSGLALPRGRGDTLLAQRFGVRRSAALWVLLWVLAAAATFGGERKAIRPTARARA